MASRSIRPDPKAFMSPANNGAVGMVTIAKDTNWTYYYWMVELHDIIVDGGWLSWMVAMADG